MSQLFYVRSVLKMFEIISKTYQNYFKSFEHFRTLVTHFFLCMKCTYMYMRLQSPPCMHPMLGVIIVENVVMNHRSSFCMLYTFNKSICFMFRRFFVHLLWVHSNLKK